MQWTDINDIAIELLEAHPDVDPLAVNFVDLRNWVLALPDLTTIPIIVVRRSWKPYRPPGSKSRISCR